MRLKWTFWDILGHLESWDILGDLGIIFDEFGAYRQFSHAFPTILSPLLIERKKTCDGPTDGPTDRRTDRPSYGDAWTHLKIIYLYAESLIEKIIRYM